MHSYIKLEIKIHTQPFIFYSIVLWYKQYPTRFKIIKKEKPKKVCLPWVDRNRIPQHYIIVDIYVYMNYYIPYIAYTHIQKQIPVQSRLLYFSFSQQ